VPPSSLAAVPQAMRAMALYRYPRRRLMTIKAFSFSIFIVNAHSILLG